MILKYAHSKQSVCEALGNESRLAHVPGAIDFESMSNDKARALYFKVQRFVG